MRQTYRRVMAIFLTLVMCLGIIPASTFAASDGNIDITFVVDGKVVGAIEIPYGWYVSSDDVPEAATAAAEAKLKAEADNYVNYRFDGWYDSRNWGFYNNLYEDTTYYASYSWDTTLTFLSADGEELGKEVYSSNGRYYLNNINYDIIQAVEDATPENMWFKGWMGDDGVLYYPNNGYTFTKDLTFTATYDWWRKVDFKDDNGSDVGSFTIHNELVPTSYQIPDTARKLLAHTVDKIYLGYVDKDSNLYGSMPITEDITYTLKWHETVGEEAEFHKMTSFDDLQAGSHYIFVATVTDEVTGEVTRYVFGSNNMYGGLNGAVLVQQTEEDYNAGILRLPSDAESVLTLNSFSKIKDANGNDTATAVLRASNGMRLKLGTSSSNTEPLFNANGGNITIGMRNGNWYVGNSTRYLNYREYDGSPEFYVSYSKYASSAPTLEIYTDASEENLGEARYVEYSPLDMSITDITKNDEMLIVYTDSNGRSWALSNGVDGKYAVPVTVENNTLIGDKVTTAITTDRANAWVVSGDKWDVMDDAVSGMPSDENLTVLRNRLTRGSFDLWVSSSALVRNNTENTAQVYFYIDNTDPADPQIRLHGDRAQANRYLGWDADKEDFIANELSYDDSITVRIYGPEPDQVSYQTKYVRISQLETLKDFTESDRFIIVLPLEEEDDNGNTVTVYRAMGYNVSNTKTWLFDVDVEIDAQDTEYIMVDSMQPYIFNGAFTGYTVPGGSSSPYLTFDRLRLVNNGYCFYPQNLNNSNPTAPFRTNSDSKGRFEYESKTDETIYLRGNGSSTYLTNIDGVFSAAASSSDRQPVMIFAPQTEEYVRVRYNDVHGEVYHNAFVQGTLKLASPDNLFVDENGNVVSEGTPNSTKYTFVGWSTNEKFANNAFLSFDASCNLYESYRLEGGTESTMVKDEYRALYDLVGNCEAEKVNTIEISSLADYINEDGELYLYPIYAVFGYGQKTYVAAYAEDNKDMPIVGVSDWKSRQDEGDAYEDENRERWLGSINIEIYLDGEIWVPSTPVYFGYHNDDAADLNIKFIWNDIVDKDYGGDLNEYLSDPSDNAVFPKYDQVGHFMIDGVYAIQGNSEGGLKYKYNWISSNGGRLDNVAGGTTVKLYVTTKYNVKYYLQQPDGSYKEIKDAEWYNGNYYSTPGTSNAFDPIFEASEFPVTKYNDYYRLMEQDGSDDVFVTENMKRGGYNEFAYSVREQAGSVIDIAKSPEKLVAEGYKLDTETWKLIDKSGNSLDVDWSVFPEDTGNKNAEDSTPTISTYTLGGTRYNTHESTSYAYVDGEPSYEADTPYTFHMYAPIKLRTGDLKVSKTVDARDIDTSKKFSFKVTLSDTTISGKYGDMTFVNGVAEFELAHGESMTAKDLPIDIEYTVEEESDGDYTTKYEGKTGTIVEDETVEAKVTNIRKTGNLKVTKTVVGKDADYTKKFAFKVTLNDTKINGKYGDMTFVNGVAEFELADGESATAEGLPTGISYTVEETSDDKYITSYKGETGTIDEDVTKETEVTNTRRTGDLTVSKTVEGRDADIEREFTFKITLSDTSINGEYGDMIFENGVAAVTLKHGQSATATGLPTEIEYTVEEIADEEYTSESENETGTIVESMPAEVSFTNTRKTGNLTVSKTVKGEGADLNKKFTFTITLSDTNINGTYGDITFENGVATVTLANGESATAEGLPTGVTYTVEETADEEYMTESTGETGTIEEDVTAEASFVNTTIPEPEIPETGEWFFSALMFMLISGIGIIIMLRRKKSAV